MLKHAEIISKMTLEEKCYLLSGKNEWESRGVPRLKVPSITFSDGPSGLRRQKGDGDHLGLGTSLPATCFPAGSTLANSWDTDLAEKVGICMGREAAAQGVDVLLAPAINIKRNPLGGRNFEYYSEDPYVSGKMAAAFIRGVQSCGVSTCPKHFAANSQETCRMSSDSVLDERTLREIYLTAFEIAVKEGKPGALMSAYNKVNGCYANENPHLLKEILREEWGFRGVVVSDWGGSNDHVQGVKAGSHMEMPTTGGDSDPELVEAVRSGKVAQEWIDTLVDEILELKCQTQAVEKTAQFSEEAHHAAAREAALNSIVLLKNEGEILPLQKGKSCCLVGDFAQTPRYQGAGSSVVNPTKLENLKEAICGSGIFCTGYGQGYRRDGSKDEKLAQEACRMAQQADAVLYCMGLDETSESEGLDRSHLHLRENQIELLKRLAERNENIIVLLFGGAPVEMPWLGLCKALIYAGLGGQAGAGALVSVVSGEFNPCGKLAESYPMNLQAVPFWEEFPSRSRTAQYKESIFVGYRYYLSANVPTRFPFGYGLSYTSFRYEKLQLKPEGVSFVLTNTGERDGAEVAQLYVAKDCSRIFRPLRELKGFAKVFLKAGESRQVWIPFDDVTFRYFNEVTGRFEVEEGAYRIQIGASSEDIRLQGTIQMEGSGAAVPYEEEKLCSYYTAQIKDVSQKEFETLLGRPAAKGEWGALMDFNDPMCRIEFARNPLARLVGRFLSRQLKKTETKGKVDLNLLFVYNMPIRAIPKLTEGLCSTRMAEGLLTIINGHFFRGVGQLIGGLGKRRRNRRSLKELYSGED